MFFFAYPNSIDLILEPNFKEEIVSFNESLFGLTWRKHSKIKKFRLKKKKNLKYHQCFSIPRQGLLKKIS